MWGIIKMLAVAAAVGAGAGILAKGKIDTAINGEAPKKIPKKKFQIIEVPENFEIEQVDIIGKKKKEDKKEDTEA